MQVVFGRKFMAVIAMVSLCGCLVLVNVRPTPATAAEPVIQPVITRGSPGVATQRVVPGGEVVTGTPVGRPTCPNCGQIHGNTVVTARRPVVAAPMGVETGSSVATSNNPMPTTTVMTPAMSPAVPQATRASRPKAFSGARLQNVLAILNRQRSRQGLGSLRYDPQLQAVAERRVQVMARTGSKSHPSGSIAPGRYEGVGWSSSFSPSGVHACFTSDPNMTVAGAAMARGHDGVYFAVVYR